MTSIFQRHLRGMKSSCNMVSSGVQRYENVIHRYLKYITTGREVDDTERELIAQVWLWIFPFHRFMRVGLALMLALRCLMCALSTSSSPECIKKSPNLGLSIGKTPSTQGKSKPKKLIKGCFFHLLLAKITYEVSFMRLNENVSEQRNQICFHLKAAHQFEQATNYKQLKQTQFSCKHGKKRDLRISCILVIEFQGR